MNEHATSADGTLIPLVATAFFVVLNGFFVAAEFALVKVRASRIDALAQGGSGSAKVARKILDQLGHYLSACQLGITLASLILGWLAEPAFAALLLNALESAGVEVSPDNRLLHGAALVVALTVVTGLHMVFGEQAPKIWAIQRAESTTLLVARPLRVFTLALKPLIWVIDEASSLLLRLAGLPPGDFHGSDHDVAELRAIVAAAAQAGHISPRQSTLAQNVFGIIGLETRHILVPRVDVEALNLQRSAGENLELLRKARHSRYPLCEGDLDSVVGIVHVRDVVKAVSGGAAAGLDLRSLARPAIYVPESQPLSKLIVTMQNERNHAAVVVDEHGTATGLAFLEDALEEIVGPLRDEFDEDDASAVQRRSDGSLRVPGRLPLHRAADLLGLADVDDESETLGGLVVGLIGRMPARGDEVRVGSWTATVEAVARRRISWLELRPARAIVPDAPSEPPGSGRE